MNTFSPLNNNLKYPKNRVENQTLVDTFGILVGFTHSLPVCIFSCWGRWEDCHKIGCADGENEMSISAAWFRRGNKEAPSLLNTKARVMLA